MYFTNTSCNTIIIAKNANTIPAPTIENNAGTKEGTIAAKTQCTELPNDCPDPRK